MSSQEDLKTNLQMYKGQLAQVSTGHRLQCARLRRCAGVPFAAEYLVPVW